LRYFNRLYGVKPGRDAPKLERLLWFRRYYLRSLVLLAPLLLVLLLSASPTFTLIVVAVSMTPWCLGFARIHRELHRERQRTDRIR
jgi:hypothetical protein